MVAGLVGEVVDGLHLALLVGVRVGATDDDHGVRLVLLVEGFLQLSILLTVDSILSLEATKLRNIFNH